MSAEVPEIKYLFRPRSVAVVGASGTPGKIGYSLMSNILSSGYEGEVYPINPKGGEILGRPVYKSIEDVPGEVDIALIAVPASLVKSVVQSCARKKVRFLPIITSGFSEVGNIQEEREIVEIARSAGMRIIGPNMFGIFTAAASLNATFGPRDIMPGGVAIITQSGALGIAMIGKSAVEHVGLSTIISVGNKSDIDEADLLEYLAEDGLTRAILIYMEGVHDGPRLLSVLKHVTRVKPVVVIKSGRSKRGAMAAASHTGSLAGSDEVFDAVMRQAGVLRADSIQDAFEWSKFLASAPLPQGRNTVIVTNGGGVGVLATDACERFGVKLYDDAQRLHEIFDEMTPSFGSTKNPIDITGQASADDYVAALKAAAEAEEIHAALALYCETAVFDVNSMEQMIERMDAEFRSHGKPVLFALLGGEKIETCIAGLRAKGVAVFGDVYSCVGSLGALYRQYEFRRRPPAEVETASIDVSACEAVIANALSEGRNFLLAHEGRALMEATGVPMPKSRVVRSIGEAVEAAEEIGYPVVLKIVSRDILHKSDAGGVALDLENKGEVLDAYQAIIHNAKRYKPDARIDGVEVAEMLKPGLETIVGARIDRTFGPTLMFGLGGIYVEVMKDVAFRALPLSRWEVMSMLQEIRTYPLLLGVRGEDPKDIDLVVDTLIRLGTLLLSCKEISDIEINPLVVYEKGEGVRSVDVRVLLHNA